MAKFPEGGGKLFSVLGTFNQSANIKLIVNRDMRIFLPYKIKPQLHNCVKFRLKM